MNQGMLSVDEALAILLAGARPVAEVEQVPTLAASGRVLARAQHSTLAVPPLDNTSMDGYAVRAADCASGEARLPVSQRIPAGSVPAPLAAGTAARIFTGATVPPGADAVVMQEYCVQEGDAVVVRHRPQAGEWVRRAGEDIRAGDEILAAGMKLRPQDTGLAASVGIAALPLYRRLKVAVFFTGDELVMPGEPLPPGRIYNSNRYSLNGLLQAFGCAVKDYGIVPDRLDATRAVLREAAADNDLIVTSGGVSVGEEDHIKPAVDAGNGRKAHFIGLPGNPVSSFVTFLVFVRPFLLRCQGVARVEPLSYPLRADFDWVKPDTRREFLRVKLNPAGGLALYANQSSAVLTSTVWGDGFIDNPAKQAIKRGDMVKFLPYSELFQ